MRRFASLATVTAIVALATSAQAASPLAVGTLVCTGGEGVGLVLGSVKSYDCNFEMLNGAKSTYTASVTKIGLDIGMTSKSTMVWTVLAVEPPKEAPNLAGSYAGVDADAALGLGAGVKILVGGSGNSFTLQPLAVEGQTGLNLAIGIAELTLR